MFLLWSRLGCHLLKEEFLECVKQYSNETSVLSYTDREHPAYVKLLAAGQDIIPWLLEKLSDSIGHDSGDDMDWDNDPWLTISLLGELSTGICWDGCPSEHAGKLDKVRTHLLKWGESLKQNAK
jgi:hypothetical protein